MDHPKVEPGMVVLVKERELSLSGRPAYTYYWVLVIAVHDGHGVGYDYQHIHGYHLTKSAAGININDACCACKVADVIKAFYRTDPFSDVGDLTTLCDSDILQLLFTGITPTGCHVNLYNAELEDKCLEVTMDDVEQKFGCHVKIKGKHDD